MRNEGIPIVKEGLPFFFVLLVGAIASGIGGWHWLSIPLAVAALYTAYFFRNPERLPPVGSATVACPADGKVIFVGESKEVDFTDGLMKKVSIFMSLFDVHVNRVPVDGTVKNSKYHRGRFMAAFEDQASDENERSALLIETSRGEKIVVVQIAGLIARRIICYPAIGSFVLKGQRLGLIRFGSRCDLYLPMSSEILVKVGDKVLGGETIVAHLKT